jgi:hypothetical protein
VQEEQGYDCARHDTALHIFRLPSCGLSGSKARQGRVVQACTHVYAKSPGAALSVLRETVSLFRLDLPSLPDRFIHLPNLGSDSEVENEPNSSAYC